MARWLEVITITIAVVSSVAIANPLLEGDPYHDILSDPNFRPKPEKNPNKTIDQLISDTYGGLNLYMSDNFLDIGGEINAELDMVLSQEQFKAMYMKDEGDGRYKRKATRPLVYRWTDNVIPYEFITSHFNADEVYYIKKAMERWQETTCLTFRPYTRGDTNRIRFQNGNGCNSLLGMARGVQPINLQSPGCRYSGLYLHEIGHAIGLVHEHQLPDRDQYIYIIYDNVAPSMRIWFNKYSTKDVNQYGVPFEYSSVMHYGVTAFSKDGSSQTIRARDQSKEHEIGRVYLKGLSFSDIKVVNRMYNCSSHCQADPSCKEPGYLNKKCQCVRPGEGETTTTTKPTGECTNSWDDGQCEGWARVGECDRNPYWMKENCKRSCKTCEETEDKKPDPSECSNLYGDSQCVGWAGIGECDANAMWMKENCQKACNACEGTETGTGTGTGTTNARCTDNVNACSAWARSGYCQTNMFTKENCKKSCNLCNLRDVADEPSEATVLTTSLWMSLPVAISLIRSYL